MLCTIGLVFVTCINTLYTCNIVQFSQVENNCTQDFYYACAAATGLPSYLYSYYRVELTIHSAAKAYGTNQLQLKRCTRVTRTRHEMDTKCIRTRHVLQTQTQFTKNACINALREHAGRILNTRVPCLQDSVHACVSRVAKMLSE